MRHNAFVVVMLLFLSNTLFAQYGYDSPYNYSKWISELSVVSSVTSQLGSLSLNGKHYEINPVYEELPEAVNWALQAKYEGRYKLWLFVLSGSYARNYEEDEALDFSSTLAMGNATIGIMPWDRFYLLAGGRYFNLSIQDELNELEKTEKEWIDPIVGARYEIPFTSWFKFRLRGDVGGFVTGSDLSWNAAAFFRWSIDNVAFELGARGWSVELKNEQTGFLYNIITAGPSAGFTLWF